MGSFSTYLEKKVLDHVLLVTVYNAASFSGGLAVYIALCTTTPTVTSTGSTIVEPSGNGYARVDATGLFAAAVTGTPTTITNNGSITFPAATGAGWGTIISFALVDASSAGNMLAFGTLTASKTVDAGDIVSFASSQLTITLT
jgi:hypothetical protein